MGKHRHGRGTVGAAAPLPSLVLPPPAPLWRVVTLPTLAALAVVASVWFYLHSAEEWETSSAEDYRLVDAFRKARNEDAKATPNLAPEPVFDDDPVSEAEGEAMQAHYILHRVRQIVAIRSGEPGEGDVWLATHRHTLTTRVGVATPKVAVKVGDRVGTPTNLLITNPDIVVEVRGGKVHALRAEIHRE